MFSVYRPCLLIIFEFRCFDRGLNFGPFEKRCTYWATQSTLNNIIFYRNILCSFAANLIVSEHITGNEFSTQRCHLEVSISKKDHAGTIYRQQCWVESTLTAVYLTHMGIYNKTVRNALCREFYCLWILLKIKWTHSSVIYDGLFGEYWEFGNFLKTLSMGKLCLLFHNAITNSFIKKLILVFPTKKIYFARLISNSEQK